MATTAAEGRASGRLVRRYFCAATWSPTLTVLRSRMSPEALAAPFTYDKPRDMYELGILLAQMLFGVDVTEKFASPANLVNSSESCPLCASLES